ncbi:trp operon leader peptide [Escherichia coli]|nr:trp operon leader peptide [Escherichia coli]HBB1203898.1 trp operon leader peptide [Escherichia coli]
MKAIFVLKGWWRPS